MSLITINRITTYVNNLAQNPQKNNAPLLLHLFFKPEHTIKVFTLIIVLFAGLWIMRIRMMAVEEFDDMETAFVDIEMDIPCLEAGSTGLPDFCLRIQAFNFLPGRIADTFAVCPGMDKQQFQHIMSGRFVDLQDKTADYFAVFPDNIGCTVVNTVFYCFSGNDLAVFFKVLVPLRLQRSLAGSTAPDAASGTRSWRYESVWTTSTAIIR